MTVQKHPLSYFE